MPIDLVIVFLGTNDLRSDVHRTPAEIAAGAMAVATMATGSTGVATTYPPPKVLVVAPPPVGDVSKTPIRGPDGGRRGEVARALGSLRRCGGQSRRRLVRRWRGDDLGWIDGIHFTPDDNSRLAHALAPGCPRVAETMKFNRMETNMNIGKLGSDLSVSALGLGCMGMSFGYGGQPEADSIETLRRAVELGVTFFDTAEVYGPFENERLVGKAARVVPRSGRRREQIRLQDRRDGTRRRAHGRLRQPAEHVRAVAEASLVRLGIDVIDLFYQHRVDPAVPIEETVGAMAELVREGKVRTLGLSEASAATIRRAHAIHPIAAVQSEYSLWSREPEDEVATGLPRTRYRLRAV